MNQDLKPIKSFWEKPQGTTGMIGIGLLVFGAGYLLLSNAAWLAKAMSNLTSAVFLGLGLFSLVWILSDPKVRTLIWYFYKSMVEKLTGIFVEIDPIGIMKVYLSSLKDKRRNMNTQLLKLKGEEGKLARKITDQKEEIQTLMRKASAAKKQSDPRLQARMNLNAKKASRRGKSTMKLSDLLNKIKTLYSKMDKMHYYSGIMVEDIADQIDMIETERKAIHASYSVMKSAQNIIAGNSSEADLFDRALEFVADDLGAKVGEMERFMDISQNFINGVDLDNQIFEEEGLFMLEEWEKGNTLNFIDGNNIDYLDVINSQMNDAKPEPIVLSRDIQEAPKRLKKSSKDKNFFK